MKKYIIIALLPLCMLFMSCDDFLDRQPISDLSVDTYWQTENDLKTWNSGIYDGLQSTLRMNWFYWGEIRGGCFAPRGTSWDTNLLYNGLTSTSGSADWSSLYSTIYRANSAIRHIPNSPVGETVAADYLAQAYTMRALMYFYAIRVWGNVPIITEPMEDILNQEKYYSRSDIQDVKQLMLSDIDKAVNLFGPANDMASKSKYYLNKGAAMALKTDILLWFKDFDGAIKAADECINTYGYKLTTGKDYLSQFLSPATSSEMIFNLYWDYSEDSNGFGYAQVLASGSNTIPYHPTEKYFNELIGRKYENDSRINLVLDTLSVSYWLSQDLVNNITQEVYQNFYDGRYSTSNSSFQVKCPKFTEASSSANGGYGGYAWVNNGECNVHMPIYRLADIMLLKAEALAQKSQPDLQGAIDIVNTIRNRAGWTRRATLEDYNTKDKVLNLIIDERCIEFWAEGKHWFDLVRNNKVKEYLDDYIYDHFKDDESAIVNGFEIGVSAPANPIGGYGKILWPLYQDVFRKNPLMSGQQNPPYTE